MSQTFDLLNSQDIDTELFFGQLKCQILVTAFSDVVRDTVVCLVDDIKTSTELQGGPERAADFVL
jgi:hypothetical protein